MSKLIPRIFEYFRLFRFQTGAATATAPLIGSLVIGQRNIYFLFVLFIVGILYHIYGFVLNEYIDVDVDKKSKHLLNKPLVSGSIQKKNAKFIILLSCTSACIITIIFFPHPLPIIFLILSIIFGGIYDIFGKKLLGADIILGAGFFFICLTGASTFSYSFNSLTYVICFLYFFHIIFNNAVEGGLKDIYHDRLAGAKTTASRLGVTFKDGKLMVTKIFKIFAYIITIIFIGLIFLLLYYQDPYQWINRYIFQILLIILLSIILFGTLYTFLQLSTIKRAALKRLFSAHEITSFLMLLVALASILEFGIILFLFLIPALWYLISNAILYKTLLQPLV